MVDIVAHEHKLPPHTPHYHPQSSASSWDRYEDDRQKKQQGGPLRAKNYSRQYVSARAGSLSLRLSSRDTYYYTLEKEKASSAMPPRAVKLFKPCLNRKQPLRKQLLLSFLSVTVVSTINSGGGALATFYYELFDLRWYRYRLRCTAAASCSCSCRRVEITVSRESTQESYYLVRV